MKDPFLYQQIVTTFQEGILNGRYRPGDRLPSVRQLKRQWKCTQGTIQRAYAELATQGLVIRLVGKGTFISTRPDESSLENAFTLRQASLVHQAEAFLLKSLFESYSFEEIQQAITQARSRLESVYRTSPGPEGGAGRSSQLP
jgi:DNA-binding transcriptional regulator YhcF (GntR family)